MKADLDFSGLSFLRIAPLPGSASLRYSSSLLAALSLCEVVTVFLDGGSWLLRVWVIGMSCLILALAVAAFEVCRRHETAKVSLLSTLAQVAIALKLVMLCLVISVAVHESMHECAAMDDFDNCEKMQYLWDMSPWALIYEGFLTVASVSLLILLLMKTKRIAQELKYRSITHYLAL